MTDKIKVMPFEPIHLEQMTLKECHDGEARTNTQQTAFTFVLDEKPIAVIGWNHLSPRVLQAWGYLSEDVKKKPISFHKAVKNLILFGFFKTKVQRIQISVRCDYTEGYNWARALGFECEAVMRHYGPNRSDYFLFARYA